MKHSFCLGMMGLTVGCLLACGCVRLSRAYPERQYYLLQTERDIQEGLAAFPGVTMEIRPLRVSPGYAGREFVYRTGANRYESDYYQQFFAAPEEMVTERLRDWMLRAGLAGQVNETGRAMLPTHTVEGSLISLYADFRSETAPKAVAQMQVAVYDLSAPDTRLIWQARYAGEATLGSRSPEAIAAGWDRAFADIFQRMETDLRQALGGR